MRYFSTLVKLIKICVNLCFIIDFLKVKRTRNIFIKDKLKISSMKVLRNCLDKANLHFKATFWTLFEEKHYFIFDFFVRLTLSVTFLNFALLLGTIK